MIDGFAYTDAAEHQERILSILRLLRPFEAVGSRKIRLGRDYDGGYVMLDDFDGICAAYSLGIKDDASWDSEIAERGIEVFQYDHTIDAPPATHPLFHWKRTGICGVGEETEPYDSLPNIMQANAHHNGNDLILKMDIEGAEWSVFGSMPAPLLATFRQIVCEFHGFQHVTDEAFYLRALGAARNLSRHHRVVHVHANNNTAFAIVGGVPVPACLELTFARIEDHPLEPSREMFPTPLDMPCFPGRADYQLGRFEY